MNDIISSEILRRIIADVLSERSNAEMNAANDIAEEELKNGLSTNEYSAEVGWTSCGTRVLADDVLQGEISIEEAIKEVLTKEEVREVKKKCIQWVKENQMDMIRKDKGGKER